MLWPRLLLSHIVYSMEMYARIYCAVAMHRNIYKQKIDQCHLYYVQFVIKLHNFQM